MIIVSVVRDFAMYNRLVKDNPFNQGARFVCFDNTAENKTIPVRYNSFLDSYDYNHQDWFIFCHEDWEIQEDWQLKFSELDKNSIYGPIGISACYIFQKKLVTAVAGQIFNSNKDMSKGFPVGIKTETGKEVQTFDCQCIIVHSSLVSRYKLRFDENLSFDLYAEDFCANAMENFGIKSRVFQLKCQHYSFGNLQPRFYEQLNYLKQKYAKAKFLYSTTASGDVFGHVTYCAWIVLIDCLLQKIHRFLFQKKITNSGKKCIKVCKIQLPQAMVRKVWK